MNINWYPGHMSKTKKEIIDNLKLIDVVIEILDARIPLSSQNPDIAEITKNKKKIIMLNKVDLADEKQTSLWVKYFNQKGIKAVLADSNQGKGIQEAIADQEKLESEVVMWLKLHVTSGYLKSIKDDSVADEINYFKYLEAIRHDLIADIPNAPINMIDTLVDEHISDIDI